VTITLWWHWVLLVVGGYIAYKYVMPKVDAYTRIFLFMFRMLFMSKERKREVALDVTLRSLMKTFGGGVF
jgi:hypothetical protein